MRGLTGDLADPPAGWSILGDCPILGDAGGGRSAWLAVDGLRGGGYALACDAARDAESDAESAANGLRLHFDLMVTARLPATLSAHCRQLAVALGRRKK
jgi:hypothetical protein